MFFHILIGSCALFLFACGTKTTKSGPIESPHIEYLENPDQLLTFQNDILIKMPLNPKKGFNFTYYLFLPQGVEKQEHPTLLLEPNNTGQSSDDMNLHDREARKKVEKSYIHRIAKRLKFPLLVPVFPRPAHDGQPYIHYLNRKTIEIKKGPLKRVDLQLIAMIEDARAFLARNKIKIEPKIFMNGFSSSAGFALRFTALHPRLVRAVSAGGINALPILPLKEWKNQRLPYPVGVSDLRSLTGSEFDAKSYSQVPFKLYMGEFDANDTVPFRDSWSEEEAKFITRLLGEKMMPDRWEEIQRILKSTGINADLRTYPGVGHKVTPEIEEDIFRFFSAHKNL